MWAMYISMRREIARSFSKESSGDRLLHMCNLFMAAILNLIFSAIRLG